LSEKLQAIVNARKAATTMLEELEKEFTGMPTGSLIGFARACRSMADKHDPTPEAGVLTMTEAEALKLESTVQRYGAHVGTTFGELPTEYIDWLIRESEKMVAYSRSSRWRDRS
jgi:hypothetical protein